MARSAAGTRCIMWVMAGVSEDLCFEFHYGHDLVTTGVLPMLQLVLAGVAPTMAAGLEVHAYERDPERRRIDLGIPGALRAAVVAKGTERGAGNQASRYALRAALGTEHFYDRDHPPPRTPGARLRPGQAATATAAARCHRRRHQLHTAALTLRHGQQPTPTALLAQPGSRPNARARTRSARVTR
jgi:hypothetical protein